jgi:hypothetical protein
MATLTETLIFKSLEPGTLAELAQTEFDETQTQNIQIITGYVAPVLEAADFPAIEISEFINWLGQSWGCVSEVTQVAWARAPSAELLAE